MGGVLFWDEHFGFVQMIPGTPGVVGTDIQGEEATPEERERVPLEAREGLMVSDDGLRTTAQWFGYAALGRH